MPSPASPPELRPCSVAIDDPELRCSRGRCRAKRGLDQTLCLVWSRGRDQRAFGRSNRAPIGSDFCGGAAPEIKRSQWEPAEGCCR
jgi:hypothetical protein